MAELKVEQKKKSALPWILLALGLIALVFFLLRRDNGSDSNAVGAAADTAQQATGANDHSAHNATTNTDDGWSAIDRNAPVASYNEVTNKDITVRGNAEYGVYELGEDVLFGEGKSEIRKEAVNNLEQVAASIKQRYDNGAVRLYGFTDAQGDQSTNRELSAARAESVRQWLISNGNIAENRITLQPMGEAQPKASNETEAGRAENRRVQIVAKK